MLSSILILFTLINKKKLVYVIKFYKSKMSKNQFIQDMEEEFDDTKGLNLSKQGDNRHKSTYY